MSMSLERLDARSLRAQAGGVDAFMVVRNEIGRLPCILDHHRRLGVERFFLVDNGSEDGTPEYLLAQENCHVYRTRDSFAAANFGMDWINALMARHGHGRWCLFIDADELFVYPHCDALPISEFCRFLDRSNSEGVFAIMVDMYARGSLRDAVHEPGTPLLDVCPLFDPKYTLRPKISRPFSRPFQAVEAVGGPRSRVLYPEFRDIGVWGMALARGKRRLGHSRIGRALGLNRRGFGACPPDITKIPLIRGRPGRFWTTNHRTTPLTLSAVRGALLHFKLLASFDAQARAEAQRGEHFGGGAEYAHYNALLARDPDLSFACEESRVYRGPEDLVEAKIMHSTPALDRFAAARRSGPPAASPDDEMLYRQWGDGRASGMSQRQESVP